MGLRRGSGRWRQTGHQSGKKACKTCREAAHYRGSQHHNTLFNRTWPKGLQELGRGEEKGEEGLKRSGEEVWTTGRRGEKKVKLRLICSQQGRPSFFWYGNNCSVAFQNNLSDKHLKNICKVNLDFEMFL